MCNNNAETKKYEVWGSWIIFLFQSALFCINLRFLYIQITGVAGGEVLAAKIDKKYEKKQVIEAKRGSILDTNGEVIAEDTSSYINASCIECSVTIVRVNRSML